MENAEDADDTTLAHYIAKYIWEEFGFGRHELPEDLDRFLIQEAIDAYEGGAR